MGTPMGTPPVPGGSLGVPSEDVAHPAGRIVMQRRGDMRVPSRDPDVGMAEDLLHDREGNTAIEQDGRGRVPHGVQPVVRQPGRRDRKSTRLNSSHLGISYAVFCLKKKT